MIVRVNKTENYTVMANFHLKDSNLSYRTKGLLSVVLSLPDNWEFSIAGLASLSTDGETAVKTMLNELKDNGYLKVTKKMPNETKTGRIEYEYDFYETPQNEKQEGKKQGVETLPLESLSVECQGQLNTNISNTNISNTNSINILGEPKKSKFVPPTLEEVFAYCLERQNGINPQHFIDYYEARGWELSKGRKVRDWRACIRTWESNAKQRQDNQNTGNPFEKLLKEEGYT